MLHSLTAKSSNHQLLSSCDIQQHKYRCLFPVFLFCCDPNPCSTEEM